MRNRLITLLLVLAMLLSVLPAQTLAVGSDQVKYKVKHYTEDLDGEYSLYEDETLYGVANTEVTAAALSIPGFTYFSGHEDGWATDVIKANGKMVLEMYYTRNSYTLSYKQGDTSVLTADSFKYEAPVTTQSYSKDGYTFEGWFANAELTEAVPTTMPANDVTLYAMCTPKNYTVSYISDGSTVHTESVACDAAIPAYTPEKTGYRFLGWYTEEALKNAAPAMMPASRLTLYAKWAKNVYTVTVHHLCNGTKIYADTTQSVAYQETVTDPILELDGYYYTEGNITPAADTQIIADTEMTVRYNSYLADLLALDSASFSDTEALASARALYAKLNEQQKADYTGTEHQVALFAAIKTYSESQLKTAVHEAVDPTNATLADLTNEYIDEAVATIKEDAQKVDVALLLPDFQAKNMLYIDFLTELFGYKEIKSIQINGLPAYVLTGTTVAQNPAGSDQFRIMFNIAWSTLYPDADEGTVMNLLRENVETLTNSALDGKCVTAIVSAVTVEGVNYSVPYQISFFNNSHNVTWIFENGDPDQTKATDYGSAIEKPTEDDPTKTGYEFVGWQGYTENMKMGKTDVTFTAQWTANEYTVTLEPNGGTLKEGDSSTLTVTYDGTYALPTPLREGYTFAGWYLGQEKIDNNSTVMITEDKTFEAHWEVGQGYPIVYVLGGGVLEAGKNNPEQYNVETESFVLNNPVREGYTFLGWTGSNGEAQQTNVTVNKGTTGALSFTANWEIIKYTITYNTDGGSLIASVTQDYGTAVTPPADPTKTGYSFNGWDTVIPVTMPARSMEIKALWTINQYTITFNTDGGDILDPITQNYGTPITAPADPSRIGYTFKGWYEVIPETMPAENMTITAKWSINQHTITFVTVEDSVFAEIKQNYGTPITVPADPSRIGYTFKGWYEVIPETMPDQDMTITAKWTANTYTVSFDANGGSDVASKEVTYDAPFGELASSERAGYEFLGWYTEKNGGDAVDAETIVSLTEDTILYAHWNKMGEIPYRVEHYLQDVEGDGYTLVDTANLTGPTDAPVEAKKNAYNHFTCNSEKSDLSGVISGDGTSVLKIYYDRELFTVTWKLAGREITECYRYQAIPSCKESTARADDDHATYSFSGWDKKVEEVTADTVYTAQYQESYEAMIPGGQTWRTLQLALENAKPGDTVRIEKDVILREDAAVPAGVTLLLPCMDEDTGYVKQGGYLMSPDGTDATGGQGIGPNAKLYRSLTVAEGVQLRVSGSLLVNAVTGRPSAGHFDQDVTGGYAQLNLLGNVTVENGAHLDAFGFVKGSGLVTVKNGGTVGDLYVVRHWRGGTQALKMYEAALYPMNEYDCHNIESMIRIEYGGSLEGIVKMYAGGSYNYTRFPQVDNNNGLIRLTNASSYLVRTYADGRERYEIFGGADFSNSTLKIVGIPLSTGSYIYPIDGDIDTVLHSGSYRFANDFKYLPGATVMVNSGAELAVTEGHTVVFYQAFNNGEFSDNTRYPERTPALLSVAKGAKFTNAGTFAGAIYTESADILIGTAPVWKAVTRESNCMASGRPKEEHTLEIAHTLSITRPGYTWKFGEDLSIVWIGGEADYSAVEAAKAMIPADLSEYTEDSVQALNDALAAVEKGLTEDKQAQVDAWAKAIRDALAALVRKDGRMPADYTAVMDALAQVPGDLSVYTEQTREALTAAVNAVRIGLTEDEQAQVDAWAKTITEAIAALIYRPADYSKVENAKKNIPADLTVFTEESVKVLNNALESVIEGVLIDRQAQVDAWAKAIEAAIAALEKKPCDGGDHCPGKRFTDMPDVKNWAHEGIDFVISNGLFNGMNNTTFAPKGQMTRAMLVTVLWRLAGEPKEGKNIFTDVKDGSWYSDAVAWASKNGVVDGIGGGKFAPADIVTREQLATILYRYAGRPEAAANLHGFSDQNKVSAWAKDAMCWAIAGGIIRGAADNGKLWLNPQKGATRAEVAAMIMRFAAK